MLAALEPIRRAVGKCTAWQLQLDKLSFERDGDETAKTRALHKVCETYQRSRGFLEEICQRRMNLYGKLEELHGARFRCIDLTGESRLLLHLGRASVLENVGLCADRTTGLPTIPGSALKGVLSTWAYWEGYFGKDRSVGEIAMPPLPGNPDETEALTRHWIQRTGPDKSDLARRIFGSDNPAGSEHGGKIVFVGGSPKAVPDLGLDIVNPHHDASGNPKRKLTPNVFLCVEPNCAWRFAFYARPGLPCDEADVLLETTTRWLREALTHLGIGAKTAAGYGRLHDSTRSQIPPTASAPSIAAQIAKVRLPSRPGSTSLGGDYANETVFRNRVLGSLHPGKLPQLEKEVLLLRNPDNAIWLEKLKAYLATTDAKDIRRRLHEKPWFPREWLPLP